MRGSQCWKMPGPLVLAFLVFALCVPLSAISLRDALRESLDDPNNPLDVVERSALLEVLSTDARVQSGLGADDRQRLKDVLQRVPLSAEIGWVKQVLDGSPSTSVKSIMAAILDKPLDDVLQKLSEYSSRLTDAAQIEEDLGNSYLDLSSTLDSDLGNSTSWQQCRSHLDEFLGPIPGKIIKPIYQLIYNYLDKIFKCKFPVKGYCNELKDAINNLEKKARPIPGWGWNLVDYAAKIPTGLLGGNLQWVGSYEMCNDYHVTYQPAGTNNSREFGGKYCRLTIGFAKGGGDAGSNVTTVAPLADTTTDCPEQNCTDGGGGGGGGLDVTLGVGLCLPDICAQREVIEFLKEEPGTVQNLLGMVGLEVRKVFCGHELDFSTDTRAQAAVYITVVIAAIVLVATLYDGLVRPYVLRKRFQEDNVIYPTTMNDVSYGNHVCDDPYPSSAPYIQSQSSVMSTTSTKELIPADVQVGPVNIKRQPAGVQDRLEAAFASFSILASFRKVCDTRTPLDHLHSVDGVRFLSLAYAIGGNTFIFGIIQTESLTTSNLLDKLLALAQMWIFQPIINYSFTGDSFLVVSGVMVAYQWLRLMDKADNKIKVTHIIRFYLHKYWSFIPMMMLVMMIYTCLYKYLVSGPLAPPQITDAENCKPNWWHNLLMVGNLADTSNMCLGWTWYVPLLFQLHIITPLVLVPLTLFPLVGWIILAVLYVIYISTVSAVASLEIYGGGFEPWYFDYLLTPWCRAGPYFIGMAVGIVLHQRKRTVPKNTPTIVLSVFLWALSLAAVTCVTFCTYSKYKKGGTKWSRDETVAYDALSRTAWGLAIAWIIFSCETGLGGFIGSILKYRGFLPLSRLSYPVLIVHAIFLFRYAYTQMDLMYINFANMIYVYFGHMILVYMIGFIAGLIFHFPFMGLENALFYVNTRLEAARLASCPEEFDNYQETYFESAVKPEKSSHELSNNIDCKDGQTIRATPL